MGLDAGVVLGRFATSPTRQAKGKETRAPTVIGSWCLKDRDGFLCVRRPSRKHVMQLYGRGCQKPGYKRSFPVPATSTLPPSKKRETTGSDGDRKGRKRG